MTPAFPLVLRNSMGAILGSLLATGCAVPFDESPRDGGVELPDRFASTDATPTATEPLDVDWWRDAFDAPQLDALVAEALVNNRSLQGSAARLAAALAESDIQGADQWPQISASLGHQRQRQNFIGLPIPGSTGILSRTFQAESLSLDLSWELDLWGRLRAGELAADAEVEAAAADRYGAWLTTAASTTQAVFLAIEARQQLELDERIAASYERTVEQVQRRFAGGTSSALDLRLARTDLATARATTERQRQAARDAVFGLEILLGRYPSGRLDPGAELPELARAVPAGLPADLLQRRPDLVAAERRLAAADARLTQARASLYPRISLTASGGTSSQDLEDLVDTDFRVWSFAANLLAPLFQGGRLRATVRQRDANRIESIATFGDTLLTALREVESSLTTEDSLAAEERHRADAAEQARVAAELSRGRYQRGLIDIITLLSAERAAAQSEGSLIQVRRERLDARVNLILALGGGIENTEPEGPDQP